MTRLIQIAETFFQRSFYPPATGGLRPRFDALMCGFSGSGKSHLLRMLSSALDVPLLRVSYAEWIVCASRETPHTLGRIHSFVEQNGRGIIHVDELDKFRGFLNSDWSIAVIVELFLLLDRSLQQPIRNLEWSDSLRDRLASSFLIIGTGTWQSIWTDLQQPTVGFGSSPRLQPAAIQKEIIKRGIIPAELLRRFRSQLIFLPPPTEVDYRAAAQAFGLDKLATQVGMQLDYAAANEMGLGARWLEEQLADLLCAARRKGVTTSFDPPAECPDDIGPEEWTDELF